MSSPMMRVAREECIETIALILCGVGAEPHHARIVAEELTTAEQMGLPSHGLMRVGQYVEAAEQGDLDVRGPITMLRSGAAAVVVDGGRNFGLIGALSTVEAACARAAESGACVAILRNAHHVGRLGAVTEAAADRGFAAIATATVRLRGHFVAPTGGRDGRLGTNPISYAFPASGSPIVSDFATSVIPEGTVRLALQTGRQLPEGAVIDASGHPTTRPEAFYGPPRGSLLPIGGHAGHKGYALALLAELAGAALVGDIADDAGRAANSVFLVCMDPAAFELAPEGFDRAVAHLEQYVTSSTPIQEDRAVMLPGEREQEALATAGDTVTAPTEVWRAIEELLATRGLRDAGEPTLVRGPQ